MLNVQRVIIDDAWRHVSEGRGLRQTLDVNLVRHLSFKARSAKGMSNVKKINIFLRIIKVHLDIYLYVYVYVSIYIIYVYVYLYIYM